MRIACVYLPSFPLQAHVRQAPHLAGAPLAVADSSPTGSTIVACSRAAWAEGIRPGMPVAMARVIAPDMQVVTNDAGMYEQAMTAVLDTLMSLSDTVDAGEAHGANRAVYVAVPARVRGAAFGQKILAQLSRQGFRGRVGVADDRFTAHAAAVTVEPRGTAARLDADARPPLFHQSCTAVPRGGSAAFLAPLPLSYLPIDPDVQHMLQTCGVKTLGDFAALPPPSVSRAWIDIDFQALARGDGPAHLRGMARDTLLARPVVERMDLPANASGDSDLGFALRTVCDRACLRLEGRDRDAAEIRLGLVGPDEQTSIIPITRMRPTSSSRDLVDEIGKQLALHAPAHPILAVKLEIAAESEPVDAELALFAPAELGGELAAEPEAAQAATALPDSAAAGAGQARAEAADRAADGHEDRRERVAQPVLRLTSSAQRIAHQRPRHARHRAGHHVQQQLFERYEA